MPLSIRILVLATFLVSFQLNAQKITIVENGAIYKFKYHKFKHHKRVNGALLSEDNSVKVIETIEGDTITFNLDSVRKAYLPDQIRLFSDGKFHYNDGKLNNYSLGLSDRHVNLDYSFSWRLNYKFEIGGGIGFHYNTFEFFTSNNAHYIDVISFPMFVQAKYAFTNYRKRLYLKGRVGYANNIETWNMASMKDGIMLEGGLGILFASKMRVRHYFELSQYTSYAKGSAELTDPDVLSDVDFAVWFNRFIFTYGIEFGK